MGRLLSRVAEIAVEDPDLLRHPAQCLRLVRQIVLAFLAFLIEADLARRRLANVDIETLAGPVREGLCLLQGLLLCGICGRRLTVRYTGNRGLYPTYECNSRTRDGPL